VKACVAKASDILWLPSRERLEFIGHHCCRNLRDEWRFIGHTDCAW